MNEHPTNWQTAPRFFCCSLLMGVVIWSLGSFFLSKNGAAEEGKHSGRPGVTKETRGPEAPAQGLWRHYEVYAPEIFGSFVVNAHEQRLKYNHDSTIAWFRDRWICLWNANDPPLEGRPGQLNYMSTSPDGRKWSKAVPCFSDPQWCKNPVPCARGTQWQPNLIIVKNELWAVWSQNSRDKYFGCYVSRLEEPGGKWQNELLLWNGSSRPVIDGKQFRIFPTQNPIQLKNGRILVPVTIIGPKASDAPANVKSWWATEKRDSVLTTDDIGRTWQISPGTVLRDRTWAQWEPTVWELDDGRVLMFARNNDFRGRSAGGPRPAEMLLWSQSDDSGNSWSPLAPVPLETVASRMHVVPFPGNRFAMVHNDWPAGTFVRDRYNLALFFTRGAGIDFVAGPGLTRYEPIVAYPQMWVHGNRALVSYSQGLQFRSIKVASISPLPVPGRYYLFPRSNRPAPKAPESNESFFRFSGGQYVETRKTPALGRDGFTVAARIRVRNGGVLLDTRRTRPRGGLVWALRQDKRGAARPFIHLATPEENITSPLELPRDEWCYLGASVDNRRGRILFVVNAREQEMEFSAPAPFPLKGTTGYIGLKRFPQSMLVGFDGDIRSMVLSATVWSSSTHQAVRAAFEKASTTHSEARAMPQLSPEFLLDATGPKRFSQQFALPEKAPKAIESVIEGKRHCLRFHGQSSAGVDLDENHRERGDVVEVEFQFRVHGSEPCVLLTTGDTEHTARVLVRSGQAFVQSGGTQRPCQSIQPGKWYSLNVRVKQDTISVRINGRGQKAPGAALRHTPLANWLYLGQGYRQKDLAPGSEFLVDVGTFRTRVMAGRSR